MATEILIPWLSPQFFASGGGFLVGGQLFTYAAGTNTPAPTYTDSTGLTPNTNPVIANSRGEMSVYIPPNVGFKMVLQDTAGNTIWTRDNVVNSQLISLYAGVDTGIVNALVLNFAANFTVLTDGIVLYFIPANSNTGPVTVNVNGLGVVQIINQNGTALTANELLAGQVATIMYKGGNWLLIQGAAQGLVAWGGTDTGIVNAYVIALTNQYFSYLSGNTLFWIPSVTNTGASTINVKGLGAQNIFQSDGTALNPGQLIAGQLTEMVYTGTYFRIIYPIYSYGSFTCTLTGCTTAPTVTVKYAITGGAANGLVTVNIVGATATSNSTSFGLSTWPNGLRGNTQGVTSPFLWCADNGITVPGFIAIPNIIGGAPVISIGTAAAGWTNSGTKGLLGGSFSYVLA